MAFLVASPTWLLTKTEPIEKEVKKMAELQALLALLETATEARDIWDEENPGTSQDFAISDETFAYLRDKTEALRVIRELQLFAIGDRYYSARNPDKPSPYDFVRVDWFTVTPITQPSNGSGNGTVAPSVPSKAPVASGEPTKPVSVAVAAYNALRASMNGVVR